MTDLHLLSPSSPWAATLAAGRGELRLDAALRLIEQSGGRMPGGAPGSQAWLQDVIDALCDLSSRDALTGLANRRAFEAALAREMDRTRRGAEPPLLLIADLDHLRSLVDLHGPMVQDTVLRAVARTLEETLRPMDLAAHLECGTFGVVVPSCSSAHAVRLAEQLRQRIESLRVSAGLLLQVGVTASIGGAYGLLGSRPGPGTWLSRADLQLSQAKAEGGNRTCLELPPDTTVSVDERQLLFNAPDAEDPA